MGIMDSVDKLLGKLDAHRDETNRRLDRIEIKIDSLQGFRGKLLGGMIVISFIVSILVETIHLFTR